MTKSITIVGAGVTGSALAYVCAKYTDIEEITVIDKNPMPAQVNSLSSNNSQTLHCGDIETNYSLEKALVVKAAANMLCRYATAQDNADELIFKYPKMVLGVGHKERATLFKRYGEFHMHYPNLKLMSVDEIREIEPNVVDITRTEGISALGTTDEYTAVNFEALANSFLEQARACTLAVPGKVLKTWYGEQVTKLTKYKDIFYVTTTKHAFLSDAVVVNAGGHSLQLAHKLGYGLDYSVLPIAGSYYFTPHMLNGKVYTIQNDVLPFAAVHGDPDVDVPDLTRFGPTALPLPMLERRNNKTIMDFLEVFKFDRNVAKAFWNLFKVKDIRNYMFKNILYEIPFLGKRLFLKEVQKIIPSLTIRQLAKAKGFGGIRPQLIDKKQQKLVMGTSRVSPGNGLIFNMTPSPGGTSCLQHAEEDMRVIAEHLGATIDEEALYRDLHDEN